MIPHEDKEACIPAMISTWISKYPGLMKFNMEELKYLKIDVVFPVLHGKNGEDGTVQA